jgi:predicted O-methyltransferase YrrM
MNLADRYQWLCQTPSDIVEHLPTLVSTVNELQATKVIELGVRYGLSTVAWLYALENRGQLWAVDCSFPTEDPNLPEQVRLLDPQGELGVRPYWMFMLGDVHAQMVADALPNEVDIVFIDTNHVYEETMLELAMYLPKVRTGGRILLHDTAIETTGNAVTPQPPFPVLTAIREFCEAYGLKFTNQTNCNGLGTIYC